jgi:hypothetical protein
MRLDGLHDVLACRSDWQIGIKADFKLRSWGIGNGLDG